MIEKTADRPAHCGDEPPPPQADGAELLIDGQEEVFSRAEVELGAIEHASQAGSHQPDPAGRAATDAPGRSGSGALGPPS